MINLMSRQKVAPLEKHLVHGTFVSVSKLEAARRQLDTAIYLQFNDGDFISIHTLSYAAIEILDALLQAKGKRNFSVLRSEAVKPEYRDRAEALFRQTANFFKH